MTRKHTVIVKLKRSGTGRPWGIRIAGGADLNTPIVVTRSENEALQRGDVIKKIDDYDTRDMRYKQQKEYPQELPKSPIPPASVEEYVSTPISSPEYTLRSTIILPHDHRDEIREERAHLSQPYRTTPLVLPGAKVKKDAPLGECYLRHHPNPMIRAAPHHYEPAHPEVAMKQKIVHKQFNSPIGLYSEQNIADTIKCQASVVPIFIDFSFLKQKQEIQEQAKILKEQAKAASSKNVWPQFNKPN